MSAFADPTVSTVSPQESPSTLPGPNPEETVLSTPDTEPCPKKKKVKGRPKDEHIDLGVFRHLEFQPIAEDLQKAIMQPGAGTLPIDGDKILYFHETRLSDGSLFDIRECRKLFTSLIMGAPNNLSYYEKALSTMVEGEEAMFLVGPNQHWNEYFKQNQSLAYEHSQP